MELPNGLFTVMETVINEINRKQRLCRSAFVCCLPPTLSNSICWSLELNRVWFPRKARGGRGLRCSLLNSMRDWIKVAVGWFSFNPWVYARGLESGLWAGALCPGQLRVMDFVQTRKLQLWLWRFQGWNYFKRFQRRGTQINRDGCVCRSP